MFDSRECLPHPDVHLVRSDRARHGIHSFLTLSLHRYRSCSVVSMSLHAPDSKVFLLLCSVGTHTAKGSLDVRLFDVTLVTIVRVVVPEFAEPAWLLPVYAVCEERMRTQPTNGHLRPDVVVLPFGSKARLHVGAQLAGSDQSDAPCEPRARRIGFTRGLPTTREGDIGWDTVPVVSSKTNSPNGPPNEKDMAVRWPQLVASHGRLFVLLVGRTHAVVTALSADGRTVLWTRRLETLGLPFGYAELHVFGNKVYVVYRDSAGRTKQVLRLDGANADLA
eukprot:TRINITY_DN26583_c0_g1_i1.p1 TRINITY_DN26583_c0_g1~~TRINITY_DN26583_c0_g1_i1.p1  ORF type:complete len:278 (-),score=41.29 TRINITY_DN26583_c0_g1_i1:30-863(-)